MDNMEYISKADALVVAEYSKDVIDGIKNLPCANVITLPCKIGDTLWYQGWGCVESGKVYMIAQCSDKKWKIRISSGWDREFVILPEDIGTKVFNTQEEAMAVFDKALKRNKAQD